VASDVTSETNVSAAQWNSTIVDFNDQISFQQSSFHHFESFGHVAREPVRTGIRWEDEILTE
jgi:hypothetical protein